ncbi:MAG: transporter [Acidimicrobiaceae bacterium]|nr:transporter [Acidimicrobiaceae bacterium]
MSYAVQQPLAQQPAVHESGLGETPEEQAAGPELSMAAVPTALPRQSPRAHGTAFWFVAAAFLLNMAFSAVPTPIYVLYQRRDHFSNIVVTLVFAAYAIGVVVSLFLAGHVSDWIGRRRVFVPALLINAVSALVFIFEPSLPGLVIARIISGVSVGLTTATATAYLSELHAKARPSAGRRRADVVATASNLGGIGVGPLAAGLLLQFAPYPLSLSYIVFGAALVVLAVVVALSPETRESPLVRPKYRPQRIAVPKAQRAVVLAATMAGLASFAVYGVFNSLVPSFLATTLHDTSHALAGAVAFSAFAGGAVAQIAQARVPNSLLLRRSVPMLVVGLALLAGGMWAPSLPIFIVGGVLSGAGGGMVFKGALVAAVTVAPPESRAETLSLFFLGAYLGLSVPVIGLGVATEYFSARNTMLVFVVVVAVAIAGSVRAVRASTKDPELAAAVS